MSAVTINSDLVREVITTLLSDPEIEGAISSAIALYDKYLSGSGSTEVDELEIKRYIAAHFVSLRDPTTRTDREELGDAKVEFSKIGHSPSYTGLMSTRWGQMAIGFDSSNILKGIMSTPPKMYSL